MILPLALCLSFAVCYYFWQQRLRRRARRRHELLELADRLEATLRACRQGLLQAHSILSTDPVQLSPPPHNAQEAHEAIDAGMRELLRQRIWLRDESPHAKQRALDTAWRDMRAAEVRLRPLLDALYIAQRDLDGAVRAHLDREHPPCPP